MPGKNYSKRTRPSQRNKKTAANRNRRLEKVMNKVGTPPGYKSGMGSMRQRGPEVPIVENTRTGAQTRIRGKVRKYKENVVKAIDKGNKKPTEPKDKFMKRMRAEVAKSKPNKPKVPVKRSGSRGGRIVGGLGGGPFGPRIR